MNHNEFWNLHASWLKLEFRKIYVSEDSQLPEANELGEEIIFALGSEFM